jgi:hypothetical protein
MSSDVAIYNASVPDRMTYAQALSGSGLLPEAYRGKPANVLVALEYGAALGIPPMVSIQQVHIVQGRPVASAQLIGALVRKAGHRLRVTGDATQARCEITRADDPDFTFVAEWTIERARDAKLTGKETWRAYPANMLKARAITECARDACPEALAGVAYTAEELGDDAVVAEAYPTTVEVVPQADDGAVQEPAEVFGDASPNPASDLGPAASSSDITDAEVVDEDTGEILPDPLASAASPAERVAAGRSLHEPSAAPTDAAFRALQAGLSAYAKAQGIDRAEVLRRVSNSVDRAVESTKDLTAAEVSLLLNRLPRKAAA